MCFQRGDCQIRAQQVGRIGIGDGDRAHSRAPRGFQPPVRIFNRDALRGLQGPPMARASSAKARRYGSGAGLLTGVSSAATIAVKQALNPSRTSTRRISSPRAPEAIAIGSAAAARRIASAAPGKSTETSRSSSSRRTALRATNSLICRLLQAVPCRPPMARTRPRRRNRGSARSSRAPIARCPPRPARPDSRGSGEARCWR